MAVNITHYGGGVFLHDSLHALEWIAVYKENQDETASLITKVYNKVFFGMEANGRVQCIALKPFEKCWESRRSGGTYRPSVNGITD